MWRALIPAVFLALPALAQDLSDEESYAQDIVLSIFYHETGHALIDILQAPVLGLEEDAADVLSTLLIHRYWEPDWAEAKARAAADFWAASAASWSEDGGDVEYWGTHSPEERRYFTYVCLFYGADPEARGDFAADMGLPEDRAETCPDEFAQADYGWGGFLDEVSGAGRSITFENRAGPDYDGFATLLADEIAYMNEQLLLPKALLVVLEPCDEANAFYSLDDITITMCTELADEALRLAIDGQL